MDTGDGRLKIILDLEQGADFLQIKYTSIQDISGVSLIKLEL